MCDCQPVPVNLKVGRKVARPKNQFQATDAKHGMPIHSVEIAKTHLYEQLHFQYKAKGVEEIKIEVNNIRIRIPAWNYTILGSLALVFKSSVYDTARDTEGGTSVL